METFDNSRRPRISAPYPLRSPLPKVFHPNRNPGETATYMNFPFPDLVLDLGRWASNTNCQFGRFHCKGKQGNWLVLTRKRLNSQFWLNVCLQHFWDCYSGTSFPNEKWCTRTIIGKKIDVYLTSLIAITIDKIISWIAVNRWTFRSLTCL